MRFPGGTSLYPCSHVTLLEDTLNYLPFFQVPADPHNNSSLDYLLDTFVSDEAAEKWTGCCEAAVECCNKIKVPAVQYVASLANGETEKLG